MSIFDDNNLIEITQEDIQDAAVSSNRFEERINKRAFANVLGARLGIKFLAKLKSKASNFESIYTIPAILKDMDISDIYTENNIRIDVRIVQDENHLCIPKAQYEFNTIPDIYIFIKLSNDFSTAEFIGAIAPDEIDKSVEQNGYYFISADTLYNEASLKKVLEKGKPKSNIQPSENEIIKAESMLVNFIDGDILNNEKYYVYEILKNSEQLRKIFGDFEKFEIISTDLAHTDEILSDSVLDVLGAQEIYKNDLSDSDIGSDINLDELAIETAADFVEDFIDENREDEMIDDNDIIEGEFEELPDDTDIETSGQLEELPSDEELVALADTQELETFDFEDDTTDEQETLEGFEGFEGLDTGSGEISFEDFELALNDESQENSELNEEISVNEDEIIEPIESVEPLQQLEEITPVEQTEELSVIDEPQVSPETEEISLHDVSETEPDMEELLSTEPVEELVLNEEFTLEDIYTDEEQEVPSSIENIVPEQELSIKNEATPLEISENLEPLSELETFDAPIDMTLPLLEPIEDIKETETFEDVQNEDQETVGNEDFATLDDIAQEFNFESETHSEPIEEELSPVKTEENIQDSTPQQEEVQEETSPEEDMSGLEEFTMDMAEAYEKANPEAFQRHRQPENTEISMEYNEDDFNMMSSGPNINQVQIENDTDTDIEGLDVSTDLDVFEPQQAEDFAQPEINTDFNELTLDTPELEGFEGGFDMQTPELNDLPQLEPQTTEDFSADFETDNPSTLESFDVTDSDIDSISFDNLTADNTPNLDDVNLDELDSEDDGEFSYIDTYDFEQDANSDVNIDTEIDNLVNNPDFDINEINIDDIDLNDPNLNIENIDIDMSDIDLNDVNSIENIPDISEMPQEEQQLPPQEEYVPDFNENDQGTIEALYNENAQGQPGEAINQSFDTNNVNNVPPQQPQKKKTSPLLGVLLIALICAFGFMKKDLIMEKINAQKGVKVEQDQNMPIEGETQEDMEDAKLLNDENNPEEENSEQQAIGDIPGEAGGPQDAASMEESLHQKGSMVNTLPNSGYAKTPEPLSSSDIKRLYWEIPQDLTFNDDIVNYLKTVGKTMKFAIQSDLLNISEMPYSNKMIVDVVIKKDGSVDNINTTVSSGSKQIDSIVLQSVKAALKYVKAPTAEFKNDSYNFSLIINF